MDSIWMVLFSALVPGPTQVAAEPPAYLIGMLTQQYEQKCVGKGGYEVEWVNPHFDIGFSVVEPAEGVKLDALLDKPVMAKVKAKPGAEVSPITEEPGGFAFSCVPMQMRSDWIPAKMGIRILHALGFGSRWKGLQVTQAKAISPVQVKLSGSQAVATVTNDTGIDLQGVAVVFHYEGCYGKPGSEVHIEHLGAVKAGEKKEVRAPQHVDRERTRGSTRGTAHSLRSVQLRAATAGVVVDLDQSLSFWGLSVECPEE